MKKLLDATDRRTRLIQHSLILGSYVLLFGGAYGLNVGSLPGPVAIAGIVLGVLTFAATATVQRRWELEYKGHADRRHQRRRSGRHVAPVTRAAA